ncbi:MAG: hypothetical protein JNK63_03950 [Chthonomonas sp.]|nr:hypothetical protein [Chthonomonas sp.]
MVPRIVTLSFVLLPIVAVAQKAEPKPAFTFSNLGYFKRFTKGTLHEFTPKGQTNLQKWTDMFTINDYPTAKTGEALASIANKVLTTYKTNKGIILQTDSVPRTAKKPAEHLIVVLFQRAGFAETAFARFVLSNGKGASMVYSHRIYGKNANPEMDAWITKNGGKTTMALMSMVGVPKH